MSRLYFLLIVGLVAFTSCINNVPDYEKDKIDPEAVYFSYNIRAEEGDSLVTIYIQFRRGGPNGSTLVLEEPSQVALDSEIITLDSARLTGAYYEIQKPMDRFAGKHTITFTLFNKKEYREEFTFAPFKLKTRIPAVVQRGDLAFDFEGLGQHEFINVIATDTSFISRDINEIDTVKNGRVIIPVRKLKNLTNGPITIQFYADVEKPVRNGTGAGGRIQVTYGFQREFSLED
jgi:hypothetical protein